VGFWILYSKEQRVRHTITADHLKERGKSDVYIERGKKNGSCWRKGNENNTRNRITTKVTHQFKPLTTAREKSTKSYYYQYLHSSNYCHLLSKNILLFPPPFNLSGISIWFVHHEGL